MSIELDNPWWLLVLLLVLPVLHVSLGLRSLHTLRVASVVLLRTLLLACVAMALAGATRVQTNDRLSVIALVDLSDSMRRFVETPGHETIQQAIQEWLDVATSDRRPDDPLSIIAFAQDSEVLAAPRPDTPAPSSITLDIDGTQATNIASALESALALVPEDTSSRIVLLSDGAHTDGNLEEQLQRILSRGVSVDVVPLTFSIDHEVLIEFLETPSSATRNSAIDARLGISSTDDMVGTVYLRREGELIDASPTTPGLGLRVALEPGSQVFTIPIELDERPLHRFEAVFEPDDPSLDTLVDNNSSRALTVTPGTGAVLVVDGVRDPNTSQPGGLLSATLEREGMLVRSEFPTSMPTGILALQAYDLIVLENVASDELPTTTHTMLREYVESLGGGLLMIGGDKSLGAGRWQNTELAPIIPVQLEIPDQLLAPPAALALVLDASGSMRQSVLGGSRTQQQIANDAAALAAQNLDTRDELGVIAFNSAQRIVVPMARNENPQEAAEKIRSISSEGGTNIYPAMRTALRMLRASEASVKHMIVLTDGRDDRDPSIGINIARDASNDDISVTTIGVGDEADTATLRSIANAGGGTFYRIVDPNTLPHVFLKEFSVLRNPLVREETVVPLVRATGSPIESVVRNPLPPIDGMVLSRPRPERDILLPVLTSEGEPVLAHWNVGLGRVGVFASDAHEWVTPWVEAGLFPEFAVQLTRLVARPPAQRQATLQARVSDGQLEIQLEAYDPLSDRPLDNAIVDATIFQPDGRRSQIRLRQSAPGMYTHTLPVSEMGQWIVMARPRVGDQALAPVVAATQSVSSPEQRVLEPDEALLRRISTRTRGRTHSIDAPELARLYSREGTLSRQARLPMWPELLVATMVLALLDIATRRIAWDRLLFGASSAYQPSQNRNTTGRIVSSLRSHRQRRRKAAGAMPEEPTRTSRTTKSRASSAPRRSPEGSTSDSLRAAKRRAREQFTDDQPNE
ncbi:MAG: VWA domain-containing protein [Phycisphaerales bacterium JB043]